MVPPTHKGRTRWSISNTKILIKEKLSEKDVVYKGGAMNKTTTSIEKWKIVQEYCFRHGVFQTTNQYRDWWEHVLLDFKRIRDYETHIPSSHDSYWNMTSKERVERKLPPNFLSELMDAMEINFGSDRAIDPRNITIDTCKKNLYLLKKSSPNENTQMDEFDTMNATCEGSLHIDNEIEKGYTGKKHKSTTKIIAMKDTLLENNKMVLTTLKIAKEGCMKCHEEEYGLMERSLNNEELNDEKLIKLDEQKVNVQMSLVASLNSIGQAMLKLSESFSNEK
ncbi:hypothetical protein SUGI_0572280 [Cryptomeria japonica]|nr:hypothetical protein SUGI_0572280 [Cryptomeria japonica]